jgi:hypothetical protein
MVLDTQYGEKKFIKESSYKHDVKSELDTVIESFIYL